MNDPDDSTVAGQPAAGNEQPTSQSVRNRADVSLNRDTLLWVLASLAVLANAIVGIFNIDRMLTRDQTVTGRIATLGELNEVLSEMKDAETGHRGYIITGKIEYLKPFEYVEDRVPERILKLRGDLAGQPEQVTLIDEAGHVIKAKFVEMKRTIDLRDAQGRDAAAVEIGRDVGLRLMDRLRDIVAATTAEQRRLLEGDQSKAVEQRWTALMTLIVGAVMAVAIILTAAAIIRLEMARRLAAFAALQRSKGEAEESLNRLDAFFQNAPCGIAYYDADLRYLRINEAFARLNGKAVADHLGKTVEEVRPDFPGELRQEYLKVAQTHKPAVSRRISIDGGVWEMSIFPVKALRAERPGLGLIGIDVTAKAAAEAHIRESESRFRTMAEAMPQIVWMTRPDGYHEYYNLRWYEFTGLTPEQSIGWGWSLPLHPDDVERSKARWKLSVDNAIPYEIEYRFRGADGTYRWFLGRANPVRDDDGRVSRWLGTCTDIEDRKQQAERLEQIVDDRTVALRRSNEELEKFAYIASHDLQEPLRKIQAFGDRLSTRFKAGLGEQGQDYIGRMLDSAGRMRRLIDDLLSFSRIATKLQPLAPVDLNAVARDVIDDLEIRIAQTGGRVEVGPMPTLPADPAQMRQLFQNLIGNALKFQRPGVPPVVTVSASRIAAAEVAANGTGPRPGGDAPGYRITVSDNGIGFEPQYADRIFELFQRLHGRSEYEGTGLGLAICKKIAHRHGGGITATSCPGEGSTFIIDLPAPTTPELAVDHAAQTPVGHHPGR